MSEVKNLVKFGSKLGCLTCLEKCKQHADPMISRHVQKKRYEIQGLENMGPASTCILVRWHIFVVNHPQQYKSKYLLMGVAIRPDEQVKDESELWGQHGFRDQLRIWGLVESTNYSWKLASMLGCRWRRSGHITRSSAWLIPHIFVK